MSADTGLKLYLAGPEIFLPGATQKAEKQRDLCLRYGFIPLHPMDNNLDPGNRDMETAKRIYLADIEQIKRCDIIVANCNGFRGVCMDDGTAYELGYGNALGKPSYGYIRELMPLSKRTVRDYPCQKPGEGNVSPFEIDKDGYLVTDDHGTSINLMMQCGMLHQNGRLIEGDFGACLVALRADLDSGKLVV
jgi:nucleoside 2-deoxyribosyltransferase